MIKVGLVGVGRGGLSLLPVLCEHKNVKVVGVTDINKNARGLGYAKKQNIPIYADYAELLDLSSLDVVFNLTGEVKISEYIKNRNKDIDILDGLSAKLTWDLIFEHKKRDLERIKLVSELAKANHELKETTDYFENILEYSGDMIITTDVNAMIVKFNKSAEEMLGYKKWEVIGSSPNRFYVEQKERNKIVKLLETGGAVRNYETKLRRKDETVFDVNLSLSFLKDDKGNIIGTVGIGKDVTDKKKLEDEILRSNKEQEDFVYTVSHDLQSPLRTVDGFSDLLKEEYGKVIGEEGLHYLQRIKNGTGRMRLLIEDLLDLSKIGRVVNPYENVSVAELINDVQDTLSLELDKKNAELIVAELPVIFCDKARIQQVFFNLITNAIKYVKNGVAPKVKIGYKLQNGYYEFFVEDEGIGVNQIHFSRIFNIFQRLHGVDEYEGTGVGLTIVKRIVELHEGDIWLKSEEGKGTTFYFTIPVRGN